MSRPLTPEERRKVNRLAGARKRELKHYTRHFPRWYEGMTTKRYVYLYRMANVGAVQTCFHPDEIYFLPKED